ncbi:MAG: hypothetical protein KDE51_19230, partial [Anaerolineales bacterium]|nr:hypothetical protein [Anaerolineales bacterium]
MRKNVLSRFLFIGVILNGLLFVVHITLIGQSLSDGTHINPNVNASPWEATGVMITVLDPRQNELRTGDIVLAIEAVPLATWVENLFCLSNNCPILPAPTLAQGAELTYTILRDGQTQNVTAALRPYPFGEVVRRSWGGLTFAAVSYLIFTALFLKRPQEDSVHALVLAAAGLLGSMGWAFGLDTVAILTGTSFWLYRFATETVYWLSVIGILHFALVFPKPLPFIERHSWLIPALYPAVFLLYIITLMLYSQTTPNKLLWLAYLFNAQSIVVTLCYGLALLSLLINYRQLTQDSERQQMRIIFFTSGLIILLSIA